MKNFSNKLEIATNLALIAVAAVILTTFAGRFFASNSRPQLPTEVKIGEKLALEGVDWGTSEQTLVLVLQKGCRFCTESLGFYKKVTEKARETEKTKIIAVFPASIEDSRKYLSEGGVKIDDIREAGLADIKVNGTPTLFLIDGEGRISKSWIGKLPPEKEAEVMAEL